MTNLVLTIQTIDLQTCCLTVWLVRHCR